jgi:hypothetical protein
MSVILIQVIISHDSIVSAELFPQLKQIENEQKQRLPDLPKITKTVGIGPPEPLRILSGH